MENKTKVSPAYCLQYKLVNINNIYSQLLCMDCTYIQDSESNLVTIDLHFLRRTDTETTAVLIMVDGSIKRWLNDIERPAEDITRQRVVCNSNGK